MQSAIITPRPSTFFWGPHLQSPRQPSLALLSHRGSCCFYRPLYWLLQCVRLPPDVDHQVHMFFCTSQWITTIIINVKPLQEQQLVDRDGRAEVVDVLLPCFNLSLLLDACRLFTGKTKTYKKVDLQTSIPHLFHHYMVPLTSRCGWVYIQCSPLGPLQDSTEVGDQCHGLNSPFKFLF